MSGHQSDPDTTPPQRGTERTKGRKEEAREEIGRREEEMEYAREAIEEMKGGKKTKREEVGKARTEGEKIAKRRREGKKTGAEDILPIEIAIMGRLTIGGAREKMIPGNGSRRDVAILTRNQLQEMKATITGNRDGDHLVAATEEEETTTARARKTWNNWKGDSGKRRF